LLAFLFYITLITVGNTYVQAVSFYLFRLNLILAVFNLVPGFPLDGGRIFRSVLWYFMKDIKKATKWAANAGKFFAIFLVFPLHIDDIVCHISRLVHESYNDYS